MARIRIPLTLITAALLLHGVVSAQEAARRAYVTHRINGDTPPVLDGRPDEPVWDLVEWAGDFTQRSPYEGEAPTQETEFKILYDDEDLYVAYRAWDTEPQRIERRLARRDHFPGDWVEINIDSRGDRHTAFSFTTSASGVRGDEYISEDGRRWDTSWDPVWHAATALDEQGWTAEVRIPLSQLRYCVGKNQDWGIQVTRRLFRKEERSCWQFIPEDTPGWVSCFGALRGIGGLRGQGQIELMPYAVARGERFRRVEGDPFADGRDQSFDFGLDGKIGVSGNFVLDFTANPDFGQVEADPAEVNLTAFETYFQERRPFFIEGNDIFNLRIAPAVTGGGFTMDNLFYSRRIGRSPQADPELADDESADLPGRTTILGAAKLSGKTPGGLAIGVLESVTAEETAQVDNGASPRETPVEPQTNYLAARLRQDLREGATMVGAMVTAVNRDITDPGLRFLHSAAYAGGVDFEHRWHDRTYYLRGVGLLSHVRGDEEALLRTQRSSARYFQRPDADHVELDTTRTALSGHSGSLRFGRSSNGRVRFETGVAWRSPGFEINDLGFMRTADEVNQFTWAGYYINDPFSIFHRLSINTNQWINWDFGGRHLWNAYNANTSMTFRNEWGLGGGVTRVPASISNDGLRGGPASRWPGNWEMSFHSHTDHRRAIVVGLGGWSCSGDEDYYYSRGLWSDLTYRPTNAVRIGLYPSLYWCDTDAQYVTAVEEAVGEETRYLFAELKQRAISLTVRLDYCITPNLTIEYYGQPYVASGRFAELKRITDPMATDYADRLHTFDPGGIPHPEIRYDGSGATYEIDEDRDGAVDYSIANPDFNYREFNSNLVLRWEYRPGSLLYLVWSQGRTGSVGRGEFSPADDLRELFELHPHNIFLIKVSRWFTW